MHIFGFPFHKLRPFSWLTFEPGVERLENILK